MTKVSSRKNLRVSKKTAKVTAGGAIDRHFSEPWKLMPGMTAEQAAASVSLSGYEALLRSAYRTMFKNPDEFQVRDLEQAADEAKKFREAEEMFRGMARVFHAARRHTQISYLQFCIRI